MRVALVSTLLAIVVILVATPYRLLIAHEYPPEQREAYVRLPLCASAIKGDLVAVRGIFVEIEGSVGFRANSKWQSEFSQLQPNQEQWEANFGLDKKTFARTKSTPVNLRISLALTGYHEENKRTIIAMANEFVLPDAGKCAVLRPEAPIPQCRAALRIPAFFATIDPATRTCPPEIMKDRPTSTVLATEGDGNDDSGAVPPGISPIVSFTSYSWENVSPRPNSVSVCPGTPVTFHTPRPYQNLRAELEIDGIRLADYVPRPVGAQWRTHDDRENEPHFRHAPCIGWPLGLSSADPYDADSPGGKNGKARGRFCSHA
jgi:hypothetical protein